MRQREALVCLCVTCVAYTVVRVANTLDVM